MKVLLVDSLFEGEIRAMGHEVLALRPNGKVLSLPKILQEQQFTPDLVFQQEALGPRTFLLGMEEVHCPKIFWAIDSHLNLFWQRWYALLFDAVATPHISIWKRHPQTAANNLIRFTWPGTEREWVPHVQRGNNGAFIGRLSEYRQVRTWMVKMLHSFLGFPAQDNLTFAEMMELYTNTRLLPNEAIAGEVNFRLMEGASCGCLVLSHDAGEDQSSQYEPGKEFLLYHDGLELLELCRYYLAHPDEAEQIAYAGWQRTQKEHLPQHRAASILKWSTSIPTKQLTASDRHTALYCTFAELKRTGRLANIPAFLQLFPENASPQAEATYIQLSTEEGQNIRPHLTSLLQKEYCPMEVMAAGALAALRLDDLQLSKALTFHFLATQEKRLSKPPVSKELIYGFWADEFKKAGEVARQGFLFDSNKHVPASAHEALIMAQAHSATPERWEEEIYRVLQLLPLGYHAFKTKLAAMSSLRDGANWRKQQDFGLLSLKAFRVKQGLAELEEAYQKARKKNQGRLFTARLKRMTPADHILKLLEQ